MLLHYDVCRIMTLVANYDVLSLIGLVALLCMRRLRAAKYADFFTPKNIPDEQKFIAFQKSQKVLNHSTLLYSVQQSLFTYCKGLHAALFIT